MEFGLLQQQWSTQNVLRPADDNMGDVMVVGGGISGIQAALDLSSAGYKVYLVEKSPTIGGKMSQLDKTFPTNDCSMCIESPKFIETDRQPNIQLMTYTDVDSVEGEPGDFTVTLLKKPRYVNEDKCTGCTVCVEYCPAKIPDPFNQNLSLNKAVHIYFSQAVPLVTYIDDSCLFLKDKTCSICQTVCENDAIDFGQKAEKVKVKVGAIILVARLRNLRPLAAQRLRLRPDSQRRHQHGLRAPALRHRPARGPDPAPLRQEASAQDCLDPLRRFAPGDCRAATATARRCAVPTRRSR